MKKTKTKTTPDPTQPSAPSDLSEIVWEEAKAPSGKKGAELIADYVKLLPAKPGVYRMIDAYDQVLYVGKAKRLADRVSSYADGIGHGGNRTARMIFETAKMEFVTTHTETEALLLETNLIKRLRPRYNILIRDDKSFMHIFLSGDHEAPGLFKFRGARTRKGDYYGPFASSRAVNATLAALQRIFLIRNCTDEFYRSRTRPCLLHQIKRCAGPCTGEISISDYGDLVSQARDFLSGKSANLKKIYAKKMREASGRLDYETAAHYRDRLQAFSTIQGKQGVNPRNVQEADVFAIHGEGGQFCIQVFFFRSWQNWGNHTYFPRASNEHKEEEVLNAFLGQFYEDRPAPRLILLSHEISDSSLLSEALGVKNDRRVSISRPRRGERRELVLRATQNAQDAITRKLAESATWKKSIQNLAEIFSLPKIPQRIEVYDNSHIMGKHAVGAMITAGSEGFLKKHYRKFNIRNLDGVGDDYAMMREVFMRRFSRLIDETENTNENQTNPSWPDLVIIDGGAGQLSAANKIMKELGLADQIPLIAIAKGPDRNAGRERFFMNGRKPFELPERDSTLHFLQRLRDESHRFAINAHRRKRKKSFVSNPLDEVPGIGAKRKRALLHHFGSAKLVAQAGVEDLKTVEGISSSMAKTIHSYFQNG